MSITPRYQFAIVKFNGGLGALLCNTCRTIIATGRDHEDRIHTCTQCRDGTRIDTGTKRNG